MARFRNAGSNRQKSSPSKCATRFLVNGVEPRTFIAPSSQLVNLDDETTSKSTICRLVALIVILIALVLAMKFLPVQQWTKNFNDWASQMGVAGIFIFIGVYAVATVLLAPGSILTIGAGLVFGLWKGFLAVSAGSTLGAALAFLVARFIARDALRKTEAA